MYIFNCLGVLLHSDRAIYRNTLSLYLVYCTDCCAATWQFWWWLILNCLKRIQKEYEALKSNNLPDEDIEKILRKNFAHAHHHIQYRRIWIFNCCRCCCARSALCCSCCLLQVVCWLCGVCFLLNIFNVNPHTQITVELPGHRHCQYISIPTI